jgi:pto-interacting protein 1
VLLADDVPELTVRDINKATRSFSDARLIGWEDKYATVYRAMLPGGVAAAAKRLEAPPSGSWDATGDAFLRQQVSVLSRLRQHDNLVRLVGYTIAADLRVLLFELPTVGTLHDVLHGTYASLLDVPVYLQNPMQSEMQPLTGR